MPRKVYDARRLIQACLALQIETGNSMFAEMALRGWWAICMNLRTVRFPKADRALAVILCLHREEIPDQPVWVM